MKNRDLVEDSRDIEQIICDNTREQLEFYIGMLKLDNLSVNERKRIIFDSCVDKLKWLVEKEFSISDLDSDEIYEIISKSNPKQLDFFINNGLKITKLEDFETYQIICENDLDSLVLLVQKGLHIGRINITPEQSRSICSSKLEFLKVNELDLKEELFADEKQGKSSNKAVHANEIKPFDYEKFGNIDELRENERRINKQKGSRSIGTTVILDEQVKPIKPPLGFKIQSPSVRTLLEDTKAQIEQEVNMVSQDQRVELDDPILHYGRKAGLLKADYRQDQDLLLTIGYGIEQKRYVYNYESDTLRCDDSSGSRYYNKSEKEREKLLLIYELKKLYLEKQEKEYIQKLKEGEFFEDSLVVLENNSSQKIFLEEQIKYIDKIIDILNEQNPNYGTSFEEQVASFVNALKDLNNFSDATNKTWWDEQVVKFIDNSFSTNIRLLESLESNDALALDDTEKMQIQFIKKCISFLQSKNFKIKHIEQLKQFQEYRELYRGRSEDFFGDLINDIKHKTLVIRKEQIEKELNKANSIEMRIKEKQSEIRKAKGDFSEEYQISWKDEERYERLLRAQRLRTNREYRDGLSRTKEKAEQDKIKSEIRCSKYDRACEVRDVADITQTISKEYSKIKTKEEYIVNKEQEVVNLREDGIPTLEEAHDLLPIIARELDAKLSELSSESKECNVLEAKEQIYITKVEADNARYASTIKSQYQIFSTLLTDIEDLKREIKRLKTAKAAVKEEEMEAFRSTIFEKAGGQKKGDSDNGFVNHVDCKPNLHLGTKIGHCLYRSATDSAIDFSLENIYTEHLDTIALFNFLESYTHSAAGGKGKHADDLIRASKCVFLTYGEVKDRIKRRESEYQDQITQNEAIKQSKESKRDIVRNDIIDKERNLNLNNIDLNWRCIKKEKYARQGDNDKQVDLINSCKDVIADQQSFIGEEISNKEEEISEFVSNVVEKREEINELKEEINKEGEYNQALALSEARWRYSRYEKIITNIGYIEKQKIERERLEKEKNTIQKRLKANEKDKTHLNSELEIKRRTIKEISLKTESLVEEKNGLIEKRSLREAISQIGLVNTMKAYRNDIKKIEKQQASELKEMNKAKTSVIRRKVYDTLDLEQKGTAKSDESDSEDIGTENQLYKKRRHKDCQDVFKQDNQVCKYFDAVDIITKILLETYSKSNEEIFLELKSKHEHYKKHVLVTHITDVKSSIEIIREAIDKFNKEVEKIKGYYAGKKAQINQQMDYTKQKILEKKKLEGVIFVKNLARETEKQDRQNVQDNLEIGADCVVIDQTEIYTLKKQKMNIDEFTKDIISVHELQIDLTTEVIKQEALKLLESRKSVSIETILLQKKDTNQKKFYKVLVHYFDKHYLKKKLEIIDQLNGQAILESEKRDIKKKIESIDRDNKNLNCAKSHLEYSLDLNTKEIERLYSIDQALDTLQETEKNERKDFEKMKWLYLELLETLKRENKKAAEDIMLHAEQIKDLKSKTKTIDLSKDSLDNIKSKISNNCLKIGLKGKKQHRNCYDFCDFASKVEALIDKTTADIRSGLLIIKAPEYKVSKKNQNGLITALNIGSGHSKKHEEALRRIVRYVAEEYGKRREKAKIENYNKIKQLEWKIAQIDFNKNASNQILIQGLIKRIAEIDNLFVFNKDLSFVSQSLEQDAATQKELTEYQEGKFEVLFRSQVGCLIIIFERLNHAYNPESGKEIFSQELGTSMLPDGAKCINSLLKTTIKQETNSVIQCIYDVFKDYYDNLNIDNSLIDQLIPRLKQELSHNNAESKIRVLMKKKSGGIEYILKKISWSFQQNQQNYDKRLDPEVIYYQILLEESLEKEKKEVSSLEILENELSVLEVQKKRLLMKDNSILRDKLEDTDAAIRYIEHVREISTLRKRREELEDSKSNKDEYYSFEMDSKRVCIRLLNADPIEKSAEIKDIDRVRHYITEQNCKLLAKKALREICDRELREEAEKGFKAGFIEIQQKLLVKGISLCGYDTFENSRSLDTINSLISVIIGTLIGENSLYQIGSINEANKRVGEWVKKIRAQYNNEFLIPQEGANKNNIQFIVNAINKEFKSDGLFINQINVIESKQNNKFLSDHQSGRSVTLLLYEEKYFALVPRDKIKMYQYDAQIDVSIKISTVLAALQTEENLLKYICKKRLQDVLGITLEHSKTLSEDYKKEKRNLDKVTSLRNFNALFCNMLEVTDTSESEGRVLFAYLAYLEKLEGSRKKDDLQETIARLKVIKSLYDKVLFRIIKAEQERRQKKNTVQLKESREELYLKELIKERGEELEVLLQEILSNEENIEKDQSLIHSLLFEKESTRDKYQEKIDQLLNIGIDLKEKLKSAQEKIKRLNENEKENQKEIQETQEKIIKLEVELTEAEEEINSKENDKEVLEIEIMNLKNKRKELDSDLKRVNAEKERKETEEAEKRKEIDVGKDIVQLIQNLKFILGNSELQSRKEEIKKSMYESNNLGRVLEELRKVLKKVLFKSGEDFWELLIKSINYKQLKQYIDSDKKAAGEMQYNLVSRLRAVTRDAAHIECEIVQEFIKNKLVKKFKALATNANYKDVHSKIKVHIEKEMYSTESTKGLSFHEDFLRSTSYGVTGIKDLPNELRTLVERRIELHYRSEEVESKKNAKFADAVKIINELNIDYKDVARCYIDEIEIIASSRFILNEAPSYPGIDLTINAVDMECGDGDVSLDTSGRAGAKFHQKASNGSVKRINAQARGDKGYEGYDGDHGSHAGNIVIKIENAIINLEALKSIKANGGNGGEGQLGGDGDEGFKGEDGKNGKAEGTNSLGGGQTTIGFGSPGTTGGCGGAPGDTGRPGIGGEAGVIDIVHRTGKIITGEMNSGQDADNILDKSKPSGGDGGEPGLYGMDQIKDKNHLFVKAVTFNTLIDRAALIKKYPKFRDQIVACENVSSKNLSGLIGAILLGIPGIVIGGFWNSKLSYDEVKNSIDYRNRDRDCINKRGERNEEEAKLRSDYRVPQKGKRDAINIDSLHAKLNEKKNNEKEISGEVLHKQNVYDLVIEQEDLENDIEKCTQEVSAIQYEIENLEFTIDAKGLILGKTLEDIVSLRNKELNFNSERIRKINQMIRTITASQNLRDKKGALDLDMVQTLAKLEKYNILGGEFWSNKENLIKIIDEYLDAVRMRLKRSRHDLKFLKKDFANKKLDIEILDKKLEDLQQERLSQIVIVAEIDQEAEEEIETQHVEEVTNIVNSEDREVYFEAKHNNKQQINESSYITTENLFDLQNVPESISEIRFILDQSVRHYRSGVENDIVVESAIKAMTEKNGQIVFTNDELKEFVEFYKKEIKRIKFENNIDALSAIERSLLLDNLKKISARLEIDHLANLSDDKAIEAFMLKMMEVIDKDKECNIVEKLHIRFDGKYLFGNDQLKEEIDFVIDVIEDNKTFYLEKCAINFTQNLTQQTECEKAMLYYNKQPNLENLASLVKKFKEHREQVLNTKNEEKISKEYLNKSLESFLLKVLENIRHHGILILNDIIENEGRSRHAKPQKKNLVEQMEFIIKDMKDMKSIHGITLTKIALVDQIIEIVNFFSKAVKNLKDVAKSKKEANRTIKSLKTVTKKLIKYIDYDNQFSQNMGKITHNYLELLHTKSSLDIEGMSEQFKTAEESIISTSEKQKHCNKKALANSNTQAAQVLKIKHQSDITKSHSRVTQIDYRLGCGDISTIKKDDGKLYVLGNIVKLSTDIVPHILDITKEIFVIALHTVVFDKSFNAPGIILYILSPTWNVLKQGIVLNLGYQNQICQDVVPSATSANGVNVDGTGKDGLCGINGRSGRHGGQISGEGMHFSNLDQLKVISHGENGSNGGHGGNGSDGEQGVDAQTVSHSDKCIDIQNTDFGVKYWFKRDVCKYKRIGETGKKGGNGGSRGLGGSGGNMGEVIIFNTLSGDNEKVVICDMKNGINGKDGKNGIPGRGGDNGRDLVDKYDTKKKCWIRNTEKGWAGPEVLDNTGKGEDGVILPQDPPERLKLCVDINQAKEYFRDHFTEAVKQYYSRDQYPFFDFAQMYLNLVSGNGLKFKFPYESFEYSSFTKYYDVGINNILKLRMSDSGILDKSIAILNAMHVFTHKNSNLRQLSAQVIDAFNKANIQTALAPYNFYNKHWIGLVFQKNNIGIVIQYMDPENVPVPEFFMSMLDEEFSKHDCKIFFNQIMVEGQLYDNCGPEVIENFIYYLTGTRTTQEAAVYMHSLLLENTLLNSVEYALKIEKNNQMIGFLSSLTPLILYKPIADVQNTVFSDLSIASSTTLVTIDNSDNSCQQHSMIMSLRISARIIGKVLANTGHLIYQGLFSAFASEFSDKLDINWQYKKMLYSQDVKQFNNILTTYDIKTSDGLQASINILKNYNEFRRLVLLKLHPDKGGNQKDFIFANNLEAKFSQNVDVKKLVDDKMLTIQFMAHKINIGSKVLDTIVDSARVIYEPSFHNTRKVVFDYTYLYSMYRGVNSYSIAISGMDVLYQIYLGEYSQALWQVVTTVGYMVLPSMLTYAGASYLVFVYVIGMGAYTGYSAITNAYSFYLESSSSEFVLKSALAYKYLIQVLSASPLQQMYDFSAAAKEYEIKINNIALAAEKKVVKTQLKEKGEFGQKLYDYIYSPYLENKYSLLNKVLEGSITEEEAESLKFKQIKITSQDQSYECCMEIRDSENYDDRNSIEHYYCFNDEEKVLDHIIVGNGNYVEVIERL